MSVLSREFAQVATIPDTLRRHPGPLTVDRFTSLMRRMSPRRFRRALLAARMLAGVAAATALGACARRVPADTPATDADPAAAEMAVRQRPSMLEVRNGSNYDVTVFLLQGGRRERLGLVTSGATASYELADVHVGKEVRFHADPVGYNRTQTSAPVVLRPGLRVVLALERLLRSHTLSTYQVSALDGREPSPENR